MDVETLYRAIMKVGHTRKGETATLTYEECEQLWLNFDVDLRRFASKWEKNHEDRGLR